MNTIISSLVKKTVAPQIASTVAPKPVNMSNVACVILGGGQGSRLYPLTKSRCKPAICFGGRYRLIDVPISNSLNSDIQKIFVVTQFLASSLHKHIFQAYRLGTFSPGFIEVLSAEQKMDRTTWYLGTADAVRQNMEYLLETNAEYFLILSGDQLYRLDFRQMMQTAIQKDVDVLVATLAVNEQDAKRMGIMKINEDHHIIDFYEKPSERADLDRLKTAPASLEKMGLDSNSEKCYLGSMGIYLFKRQALFKLLQDDPREDFGKHLIPTKVKSGSIAAFAHDGYWEDIGTIGSFYKANMALTTSEPPFDCYNELQPIYTNRHHLPGPKIYNTKIKLSIVCEGTIIEAEEICNSLLGHRAVIKRDTVIQDSYIMGHDFYTAPSDMGGGAAKNLCIDAGCTIRSAIIDKNVSIGKNVQLVNKNNLTNYDGDNIFIRDGVIVVPRGASIPDGFVL